ncbi:MAG TPA: hypothetical protein VK992_05555 [Candidatus Caenarcaniphilales bacterium]|nr:hypothetical protein [Candidatus Caenarcaniphilales bacterium]
MDHPEARAWLEEAALQPGGIEALPNPELVAHVESCRACAAERDALRATAIALNLALGPPLGARERVLANVRELGRDRGRAADRRPTAGSALVGTPARAGWLGRLTPRLAAALLGVAVLFFAAGALAGAFLGRDVASSRLANATAQLAELSGQPGARQVTLHDQTGTPAGIVVHDATARRLAVLTSSLAPLADGRYFCYLERDGERVAIGPMHFEAGTGFWAGPIDGPDDAGREGDRFLVLVEGSAGAPVLVGQF